MIALKEEKSRLSIRKIFLMSYSVDRQQSRIKSLKCLHLFLFFFFLSKMRYMVRRNLNQNRSVQCRTQTTECLKKLGALSENITRLALWSRNGHSLESNSMSLISTVLERNKHSLEELHPLSRLLQTCDLLFSCIRKAEKLKKYLHYLQK